MIDTLIFVDSNILIYTMDITPVVSELRKSCNVVLMSGAKKKIKLVTNSFVLEEVFYTCQKRGYAEEGKKILEKVKNFIDVIFPVTPQDIDTMKEIFRDFPNKKTPEAADFLHVAVMLNHNIKTICSHDTGFNLIKEITAIDPIDLARQLRKERK